MHRIICTVFLLATVVPLHSALPARAQPASQAQACRAFAEVPARLCEPFRSVWEQMGGLALFGFPLADAVEDPRTGLRIQWFERARFEEHPDPTTGRPLVLLGLLARELTSHRLDEPPFRPATPMPGCRYYPETQHNLCGGFRAYWERFGGLPLFGFPISEEFREVDPDTGLERTVQYFERQRFEWHPGVWSERFDVLLGRLGALALAGEAEAPLPPATPSPNQGGAFGDGHFRVGVDIAPGIYRSSNQGTLCTWQRIRRTDGTALEIVSVTSTLRHVVTLTEADSEFRSEGCGPWIPATQPVTDRPDAPFGDGTYIVGLDVAPGLWRASHPNPACSWKRLTGFSGSPRDVLKAKGPFTTSETVRIVPSDRGFFTLGCGSWRRIAD